MRVNLALVFLIVFVSEQVLGCEEMYEMSACADVSTAEVSEITACAESGDLESQVALSRIYFGGAPSIAPDMEKSFRWSKLAAEQGCPESQRLMGHFYYYGQGVSPSSNDAKDWWEKASVGDDIPSMCQLGMLYTRGDYGDKNRAKGFALLDRAITLGADEQCKVNYAYVIYAGRGVEPDKARAIAIFKELASDGNQRAASFLASIGES